VNLPRLIATDLDGTLIGRDHVISRRSAKVLAQAVASGIAVVLVTGRPLRWVFPAYEQLDAGYPTICANGAVEYDPVVDAVRASRPLAPPLLSSVCTRLAASIPGIAFAAEIDDGRRMVHEPAYRPADADSGAVPLSSVVARPAVKLLGRVDDRGADELAALVDTAVGDQVEATHSSYGGLVEMSARGVTKAAGLSALAARLGIDAADVLAFGDMPNDVTMLRWAGRSVVVGNAHASAREVADEVTLPNVSDGVAVYLERLLNNGA
jgi:Cof subfamily protein (haloacid dehalogenase superfamily)